MANGENTGTAPDMASVQAAIMLELGILLDNLAEGRREADRLLERLERAGAGLNDPQRLRFARAEARRKFAGEALIRVMLFIESPAVCAWRPDVLRMGLTYHLKALSDALGDLDDSSQTPDFFELSPDRKQAAVTSAQHFRGKVAAILELLFRAKDDLNAASDLVAAILNKTGFSKPRGRKSGRVDTRIRGSTVKDWRRRAMEEGRDSTLRTNFLNYLEIAEQRLAEGHSYGATATLMLTTLGQGLQDGKLRIAPLRGDPAPKM